MSAGRTALATKRVFDLIVASALLAVLSPVLLVTAVLVRFKLGSPVLFRQIRPGRNAAPFTLYKFRTMTNTRGADGELLADEKRLTPFGAMLRSLTFDEIPELFNVLRGEMSLVGPRPLLMEYIPLYTDDQRRRHDLPPGMAGPVLAHGRNSLDWNDKFARDVWYVDNWSLALDMRILARTAVMVLKREGLSAEGHVTMPRFEGAPGPVASGPVAPGRATPGAALPGTDGDPDA